MANVSPRQTFISRTPVPIDWPDAKEHMAIMAKAVMSLNERAQKLPVEVVTVSADYTMTDIDALILVNATASSRTVTLLTAAARKGRRIIIKKTDASVNLANISPAAGETLDGSTLVSLTQQNSVREYVSDGVNWQLVSAVGNATSL